MVTARPPVLLIKDGRRLIKVDVRPGARLRCSDLICGEDLGGQEETGRDAAGGCQESVPSRGRPYNTLSLAFCLAHFPSAYLSNANVLT